MYYEKVTFYRCSILHLDIYIYIYGIIIIYIYTIYIHHVNLIHSRVARPKAAKAHQGRLSALKKHPQQPVLSETNTMFLDVLVH